MKSKGDTGKNDFRPARRRFIKMTGSSLLLAGCGVFSFPQAANSLGRSEKPEEKTDDRWLSARTSTIAWTGDLIIIGATLTGVALALLAARMKKKVLLLENVSSLGTEVSAHHKFFGNGPVTVVICFQKLYL